jgi:hypothetical protein
LGFRGGLGGETGAWGGEKPSSTFFAGSGALPPGEDLGDEGDCTGAFGGENAFSTNGLPPFPGGGDFFSLMGFPFLAN